eukprot:6189401-Pleurochrysis_carterae.AAC.2
MADGDAVGGFLISRVATFSALLHISEGNCVAVASDQHAEAVICCTERKQMLLKLSACGQPVASLRLRVNAYLTVCELRNVRDSTSVLCFHTISNDTTPAVQRVGNARRASGESIANHVL